MAILNNSDLFGGRASSVAFALNWYWNSHTRMQFNYLIGLIRDREIATGMVPADVVSGCYQILGSRFMIEF